MSDIRTGLWQCNITVHTQDILFRGCQCQKLHRPAFLLNIRIIFNTTYNFFFHRHLTHGMNAKQSTHGKLSGIDGTDIQILQISAQIDGIAFFHLIHKNFFSEIYTVRKRFQPVIFTAV